MSGYSGKGYFLAPCDPADAKGPGYELDRVTSITSLFPSGDIFSIAANWGAKLAREGKKPNDVTNERSALGTAVHDAIELHLNDYGHDHFLTDQVIKGVEVTAAEQQGYYDSFLAWADDVGLFTSIAKILGVEITLASIAHEYAGTCDLIFQIGKHIYIADWKTGRLYPKHELQLAAYAKAAIEVGLIPKVSDLIIVGLRANGKYEERRLKRPLDEAFDDFLACLQLRQRVGEAA